MGKRKRSRIHAGTQTTINMPALHNMTIRMTELTATVSQLDDLSQERENATNDLKRQQEQKDEIIKGLQMELDVPKNCTKDAKGEKCVLWANSKNLEDTNGDGWEVEDWDDNSTSKEIMTAELCGEVCSILHQISKGSFKKCLTKILALPFTITNIEGFVCIIHDMATNYPDLSEVFANLSDAMFRKLPAEIGTKMRNFLIKRCDELFMYPNVDPNTRAIMRDLYQAKTAGEKKMLQTYYYEDQRQREKYINNTRFIGELWKAGSIQAEKIHACICKLFENCNDLSMKSVYSLLKTVAEHLEESNEDLSRYFNNIEEICKMQHISTLVKLDLQDLVELRQNKWNGEIY